MNFTRRLQNASNRGPNKFERLSLPSRSNTTCSNSTSLFPAATMSSSKTIGKRKRASPIPVSRPQRDQSAARRSAVRDKRKMIRQAAHLAIGDEEDEDEDEDEDEEDWEDDEEADEDEDINDEDEGEAVAPAAPALIQSKNLPVLLSLVSHPTPPSFTYLTDRQQFCGPRKVTGETMFTLSQLSTLLEVKQRLFRHFFWEMKRPNVPADLYFLRANCVAPTKDGPIRRGAWPIGDRDNYTKWVDKLMNQSCMSYSHRRCCLPLLT
jgi:hypothetical protein